MPALLLPTFLLFSLSHALAPASPGAVVLAGRARFTILTPRLVRCERSVDASFDDNATLAVANRALPVPAFTVSRNGTRTTIVTAALTLVYDDAAPFPSTVRQCSAAIEYANTSALGGFLLAGQPDTTDCCSACAARPDCTAWRRQMPGGRCDLLGGDSTQGFPSARYQYVEPAVSGYMPAAPSAFGGSLVITLASGGRGWAPPVGVAAPPNPDTLNGTYGDLDCYIGALECAASYWATSMRLGLVARSGAVAIEDTMGPRLIDGAAVGAPVPEWPAAPTRDVSDVYVQAYEADYVGFFRDWTRVSGAIAMPARAALGVWYGRFWPDGAASEFDVLAAHAQNALPLSGVMLDMDWHNLPPPPCSSWNSFVWNATLFPAPTDFAAALHLGGNPLGAPLRLSMNLHPSAGVDSCDPAYAAFAAAMGIDPASGKVIACNLVNATFARLLWDLVLSRPALAGTADWWWLDWFGCGATSNPMLWANAFFSQLNARAFPGRRPMILARNGGLGQQRYAVSFSGDTTQHEATLDFLIRTTPLASNALVPWWSHDVGGNGKQPRELNPPGDADPGNLTSCLLMLRWYQAAITWPIFRQHCDHCERRVWMFPPDVSPHLFDALRLRAALVPYLYTAAQAAAATGTPPLRPMYYAWPALDGAYAATHQHMFGDVLLAAPVSEISWAGNGGGPDNTTSRDVWLPPGEWAPWAGGALQRAGSAGQLIRVSVGFDGTPLFVRAGALVPLATPGGGSIEAPDLAWVLFPGGAAGGANASVWEDDGVSAAAQGSVTAASASTAAGVTTLRIAAAAGTGAAALPAARRAELQLRMPPSGTPLRVAVDGSALQRIAPSASADAVGWFVVPPEAHSLVAPSGALRVRCGALTTDAPHTVVVQW